MTPSPTPGAVEPPVVLALDCGTSSVRCLAYDARGRAVAGVHPAREQRVRTTADGGAELEPEALLAAALDCLGAAAAALEARGHRPAAVGVSTFWHAFLGVDADGAPLTPLYLWNDTRSGAHARALARELDEGEVHRRTGCVFHTSYLPARLAWLRDADPARFRRCARFVSFGEYLEHALLGTWRCGQSMASGTGLLDQRRLAWDGPLLVHLGLDPAQLSPLVGQEPRPCGGGPAAARVPALRGVPFLPALGDGACSNVGCGATRPHEPALMIGTSAALRLLFREPPPDPPPGLWRYLLDGERGLLGGALSNGGSVYAWLRETLRLDDDPAALEAALARAEPDGHGLTVLPFLAGERNPDYPLDATAVFAGLRAATTPADLLQAGLEAVAYRVAAVADRLAEADPALERFLATGALLRSPAWMQMLADVLGRPLETTEAPEASARGAALMALETLGELPSALDAPPARGEVYRPDAGRHERYATARARHERLYRQWVPEGRG